MKKLLARLFTCALLGIGSALASDAKTDKSVTETCHVCRYNRDLACVEFRVKPNTPAFVYAGTRYCFCSQECQRAFAKRPGKYLPKRR